MTRAPPLSSSPLAPQTREVAASLPRDVALLRERWPHVPWDRISFREGLPWWARRSRAWAMVVPDPLGARRLRVHVSPALMKQPAGRRLNVLVHEVVHVLQYQRHWQGLGWGYLRPFVVAYLAAYRHHGASRAHPLEHGAYAAEGRGLPEDAEFGFWKVVASAAPRGPLRWVVTPLWLAFVVTLVAAAQVVLALAEAGARASAILQ